MSNDTPKFTADPSTQGSWAAPTRQQSSNVWGLIASGKDIEHVAWSQKLLVEVIQIINHESHGKMIPVVRVPSKTVFDCMAWCLDTGAGGTIIPHVETAKEVAAVVAGRSFHLPGLTDVTPEGETVYSLANKHIAIIPQVEYHVGIENIDSIMAMKRVDAVMIGDEFLKLNIHVDHVNQLPQLGTCPEFVKAMAQVTEISNKYGKSLLGVAIGPSMVQEWLEQGFTLLVTTTDLYTLAFGAIADLQTAKDIVEAYMLNGSGHLA
ncbi:Pyruvate/Phosphoenolpyruvate kinase-like domain-containing protein [Mycena rosella]|uniref:Pyruvate/Phosphoenolpyruvate kinase-like domain-containing protein n=1 Tax=Mycena rosella TaxID=1033263 RepID=A0AAD7DNM4_MYCRO|nr:Pyruvate/Phosphoenolpyruvate kinase-like domain-containing protein [Mycena rosella]